MSVDRARRERIAELLELAAELPPESRFARVERESAGDTKLRDEVLSLLAALDRGGTMLEPAPARRAATATDADPSLTGFRFGAYVVGERIGAGGMGVVYRATDTRLGRVVAVKSLPPEVARDPSRRARLEQEARALAVLHHSNIASIFGAEDTDRGALLLLEYVPGSTLAELIARGPIPLEDAIAIGKQIAAALDAAHALGVVHRDLKPANIRVTDDGAVKVLDFGIAEVLTAPSSASTSLSPVAAESGSGSAWRRTARVSGTAAYMSPEQARGKRTDRRADLWAFGCVLFEMLAGARAFHGETTSDIVAAVLQSEPRWERLPADLPPSMRRVLERCLRKDPEQRLRDAADARLELDEALGEIASMEREPAQSERPSAVRRVLLASLLLALGGAIGVALGRLGGTSAAAPALIGVHTELSLPLAWDRGLSFTIHTDPSTQSGDLLAFTGRRLPDEQGLYLQRSDELAPRRIEVVGRTPRTPSFSPDGEWIAYSEAATGRLMRYAIRSGTLEEVGLATPRSTGIAWSDDDTILFTSEVGLSEMDVDGSSRTLLAFDATRGDLDFAHPAIVPGTDVVLFTSRRRTAASERMSIEALHRVTGERWTVREDAWSPIVMDRETLLWCEASGVLAAPIDPVRATILGEPVRMLDSLGGGDEFLPVARAAISPDGTLAYLPDVGGVDSTSLAWMRRGGSVDRILSGEHFLHAPRLSPVDDRVAYTLRHTTSTIWLHELSRGTAHRIGPADERQRDYPLWFPDGQSIAVTSSDDTTQRIERIAVDRADPPKTLLERPLRLEPTPNDVAPDRASLLITMVVEEGYRDLFLLPLDGGDPAPAFPSRAPRTGGRFSPDGDAILYLDESGPTPCVVVESWPNREPNRGPNRGRRVQISEGGGTRAEWRPDGRAVLYRNGPQLCEVDISTRPELTIGPRRIVFEAFPEVRYAISRDGDRFLVPIGSGQPRSGTTFALRPRFDASVRAALSTSRARPM